jgi:phenylacetate-CoA ligase
MIWNEKIECASRDEMAAIQSERLINTVKRGYHNIPGYRAKMQEKGLLPGDIKSVEDISKLPFTLKTDFRDNYPFGMFTVPMSEIVRLHASSGTTGKPTVVGYTRNDLQMWAEVVTRALCMAGAHKTTLFRWLMATDCLPADWDCTTVPKTLAPPLFPFQAEIPRNRFN